MSEDRRLSAADQGSVDRARQVLADSIDMHVGSASTGDLVCALGRLQAHLGIVLRVIDGLAPTRSERLEAQRDEEFLNVARAARMEIHAAANSLRRLDSFERALTALLQTEEGGR